jgi:hypothetical protein
MNPLKRLRPIHLAWGLAFLFFAAGQAFVTLVGVEADEALFASPLLEPREAVYLRLFHHPWPVLLMSYLGTLKTLIYNPILHIFGNSLWALREPVLLAGAFTIALFFLVLRRACGDRAALIGCGLLASDSIYLITNCYDWGPVALQHLLLLSGTLLTLRFVETKRLLPLAAAFFLWGLMLWDKALSVWLLSSIGLAAVLLFPRFLAGLLTRRRVAIALLAFILGAFPLLRFNLKSHWSTFRGNFTHDAFFYRKLPALLYTLDGRGLFGWMMPFPNQPAPSPHAPDSLPAAISANISSVAGHPTHDWMLYALGAAILLTPLARGRELRTILFCLVVLVGGWLQMAITAGAGAAVHHTILLWPLPQAIVAVALVAATRRLGRAGKPLAAVVAAALVLSNALVLNEYYAVLFRSGPLLAWSRAVLPLSDYLKTTPAQYVYSADWGIQEPLRLLNFGKLPLRSLIDPIVKPVFDADDQKHLIDALDQPGPVYILHTQEAEQFPGVRERLLHFAADHGYRREILAQISDGYGRPIFEVCRFSK